MDFPPTEGLHISNHNPLIEPYFYSRERERERGGRGRLGGAANLEISSKLLRDSGDEGWDSSFTCGLYKEGSGS